jgi:hypothetical protein
MSSDHSAAVVDVFAGIALLSQLLNAVSDLSERLQRLEQLDRKREVDVFKAIGAWPRRGRGRPKGSRNKPKPLLNGHDPAAGSFVPPASATPLFGTIATRNTADAVLTIEPRSAARRKFSWHLDLDRSRPQATAPAEINM